MKQQGYDVIVIGAGSGGLTAAVGFSKIGKRVLLIEREHMGGECTNSGCIPSKALLHAAKESYSAKQAFTYVHETVSRVLEEETPETFAALGIDVVMGEAVFTDHCHISVADAVYQFKTAVIATGSQPRQLDIPGLEEQYVLTNQNLFTQPSAPKQLLIIGGGPIGREMAEAHARLGSRVTLVERSETFLRLEDDALRPIIRKHFENLGVAILTNALVSHVTGKTAHIDIGSEKNTKTKAVEFDAVLVAVGRVPNIPRGLDAAGIDSTRHGITVDTQYRTTNKHVYAIGDVSQRLKFTHTADDAARQIVTRVVSRGLLRVKQNKIVPKVTYTTPEIAQAGLSWEQAKEAYGEDRLMRIEVPFGNNDRAKTDDVTNGLLIIIARRLSGKIVGVHIAGPRAGELLSTLTVAMEHNISLWKLQRHIFAYPTYSLIIKKAGDQFIGRQFADLKQDLAQAVKRLLPQLAAVVLWVGLIYGVNQYQTNSGLTATDTALRLFEFISLTLWGPLLYILAYGIRPVLFFPASALTILSGVFFGFFHGTLYTLIAATLSATVTYIIGRFFGKGLTLEHTATGNWVTALRENTFEATLVTRLIFLPYDLIGYLAGVLSVRFIPFITATMLGILLGTATFVAIGASLDVEAFIENGFSTNIIDGTFIAISGVIFIASLVLSKFLKRWKRTV